MFSWPHSLRTFVKLILCVWGFCALYRGLFVLIFLDLNQVQPWQEIPKAVALGAHFDLRLGILLAFPSLLLWPLKWLRPKSKGQRACWQWFYCLVFSFMALLCSFDLANFAYHQKRVSMDGMKFLLDFKEAYEVAWQGFPIAGYALLIVATTLASFFILKRYVFLAEPVGKTPGRLQSFVMHTLLIVAAIWAAYGKIPPAPPLRWSESYKIRDAFWSSYALNALLYFYSSGKWSTIEYEEKDVRDFYPHAKKMLSLPEKNQPLDFSRAVAATPQGDLNAQMNLVVFMMESLATWKTGLSNPLSPTPVLNKLARDGVYFDNFYTNATGTAKGIYATLASVPDPFFGRKGSASRNNDVPLQASVLNVLKNHKHFYFLGGSSNWAQIRSIIMKSVPGMRLVDLDEFKNRSHYVWGLSDLELVIEADKILSRQKGPFSAIIQTGSYHRPYKIVGELKGFVAEQKEVKDLKKFGIKNMAEYNALKFADYSLGYFLQLAKKSNYLDNTLIVIMADHGLAGNAAHLAKHEKQLQLGKFHSPFILYAPAKLKGRRISKWGLQTDALPTTLAALGHSFETKGFGVNLFDPKTERRSIYLHSGDILYGLFKDDDDSIGRVDVYSLPDERVINSYKIRNEELAPVPIGPSRHSFFKGLFAMFKYLVFHNH